MNLRDLNDYIFCKLINQYQSYKEKIDNYFHDIIVHIGDNYSHTKQSKNLLK